MMPYLFPYQHVLVEYVDAGISSTQKPFHIVHICTRSHSDESFPCAHANLVVYQNLSDTRGRKIMTVLL